jgi:hypothetical protein
MQKRMKMLQNARSTCGLRIKCASQSPDPIICVANMTQTVNNACATIALMNIVMNVPDIDLGDSLKAFKESTRRLKPPYRGRALGCNDFVRNIHNSFAR